jgi:hypothetical protein
MPAAGVSEVDLIRHPSTVEDGPYAIRIAYGHTPANVLGLRYVLTGAVHRLRVPALRASERADALWRHTCFEAFVAIEGEQAYDELNFAPSTQWATYHFARYRFGMACAMDVEARDITVRREPDRLQLEVSIPLDKLTATAGNRPLKLALAAVVESEDGTLSYWALRHPSGQPDFHHRDGFTITLR